MMKREPEWTQFCEPALRRSRGFTLIELLVVIAIIAILASILFPVFATARERSRRASCESSMHQIGLGTMQYMQDWDETYPCHLEIVNGTIVYWPQMVATYIQNLQVFDCPDRGDIVFSEALAYETPFGMNYWLSSYFYGNGPNTICAANPCNGGLQENALSNAAGTLLYAESGNSQAAPSPNGQAYYQVFPSYYSVVDNPTSATYGVQTPNCVARLTDRHSGGTNVVWADGHVKWMLRSTLEADTGEYSASKYWWGR